MARLRASLDASTRQVAQLGAAAAASGARCSELTGDLEAMAARLQECLSEAQARLLQGPAGSASPQHRLSECRRGWQRNDVTEPVFCLTHIWDKASCPVLQ